MRLYYNQPPFSVCTARAMTANSLAISMPPIDVPVPRPLPPATALTVIRATPGLVQCSLSFPDTKVGSAEIPSLVLSAYEISTPR